jgi:hypothetical protein
MSNLILSRKEYGRPIFVAVATMLIVLFVVVVVLSSLNNMSISAIRRASTIVWIVASVVGVVVYALQSSQVRKPRQAPRRQMPRMQAGSKLAATRKRPVLTRS